MCPKDPNFSDVSHLLTHIASKGHLSHYFKVQVRSRSDPDAEQKLRTYDRWYVQYDIERLLSQRMIQKESRRGNRSSAPDSLESRAGNLGKRPRGGSCRATSTSQENPVIDPKLARTEKSPPEVEPLPTTPDPKRKPPARRANMARSPAWGRKEQDVKLPIMTRSRRICRFPPLSPVFDRHGRNLGSKRSDILLSQASHAHGANFEAPTVASGDGVSSMSSSTAPSDSIGDTESSGDSSKLKGIIWPGMDLFDSASMDARRKRNQKKESTVLESMQAQSERVEPTEVIYFPTWDVKKARYISGEVESSPPSSVSPKRRQRSNVGRRPLAELDANQPTKFQPKLLKTSAMLRQVSDSEGTEQNQAPPSQPPLHSLFTLRDMDPERRFDFGEPNKHLGRRIEVFEDRHTGEKSPRSTNSAIGNFVSRNPLSGYHFMNTMAITDPLAHAENETGLLGPYGLWAPDTSNRNPFYSDPRKDSSAFPSNTDRPDQKATGADKDHLFQHSHSSQYRIPAHAFPMVSGRTSNASTGYEQSLQRPNSMEEHVFRRPSPAVSARGCHLWDHRSGALSGLQRNLGQQSSGPNARHEESSGDETIDQGIDDCLDLFES